MNPKHKRQSYNLLLSRTTEVARLEQSNSIEFILTVSSVHDDISVPIQ